MAGMEKWENERLPLNYEKIRSGLAKGLLAKLNKLYKPSARVDLEYGGKDITFFTNENGEPVVLFIGRRKTTGDITGQKYSRRIKKREGRVIKESHWDNQGKVS